MRAVLWHRAGSGLPLPQAKSPSTVEQHVILFGPEPWRWGSGFISLQVGVGRRNGRLHCWVRTPPSKNPHPISRIQAYIAYFLRSDVLRTSLLQNSQKFACRNRKTPCSKKSPFWGCTSARWGVCCNRYIQRGATNTRVQERGKGVFI